MSSRTQYLEVVAEKPEQLLTLVDGVYGTTFYFRGQLCADWPLATTLERAYHTTMRRFEEERIVREFKSRAPLYLNDYPMESENLEWLSILQHYGGPSRLLDFTRRVFVAAFFAVAYRRRQLKEDGPAVDSAAAIWAVNHGALQNATTKILYDVHKQEDGTSRMPMGNAMFGHTTQVSNFVVEEGISHGMVELINAGFCDKSVFLYQPKRKIQRMHMQEGLFLVPADIEVSFEDNLFFMLGIDSNPTNTEPVPLEQEYVGDLYTNAAIVKILIPQKSFRKYYSFFQESRLCEDTMFPDIYGLVQSLETPSRVWGGPGERTQ